MEQGNDVVEREGLTDDGCEICERGTWGNGEGGFNGGWRQAMEVAHHAHREHTYRGHMSANGVLGAGPDAVIVDGDWLARIEREAAEYRALTESGDTPLTVNLDAIRAYHEGYYVD